MSLSARKELLAAVRLQYSENCNKDKTKILDAFVAATDLKRKYAISLLNSKLPPETLPKKQGRKPKYGADVQNVIKTLWNATNRICSKRLVPLIPELLKALEKHGHLTLTDDLRLQVLTMSAATIDRFLSTECIRQDRGISTTSPGILLKNQIQIRTF